MSRRSTAAPNEVWQISANCAEREFDPTTIDEPVFQIRAGRNGQINQRSRLARFCSSRARRGPQAAAIATRPAKGTKTGSRQFVYKACMADHGQVE
jgi:hypothetical protein